MVTWKLMVTLAPALMGPMSTVTGGVPVLPLVTVPCDVLTKPTTRVVLLSGISLKVTPVAGLPPELVMVTV